MKIYGGRELIKINTGSEVDTIKMNIGSAAPQVDVYSGVYEVTPMATAQELPTRSKLLTDDIVINEIPYNEIQNESGTTVIIGD